MMVVSKPTKLSFIPEGKNVPFTNPDGSVVNLSFVGNDVAIGGGITLGE